MAICNGCLRGLQQAMGAIACQYGCQRTHHEGRVRRSAVEVDARQHRVKEAKDWRVPAKRIKQDQQSCARHEADLTLPKLPAQGS